MQVGVHVRVGEGPVCLSMLGRDVQRVSESRRMARSIFSHGLHLSRSLPHMMVPAFLKEDRVLGKFFLLSAHQCSCLTWQM